MWYFTELEDSSRLRDFVPIQTGASGSCAPESATNPIGHSHLYDPTVLLQTWLAPQASGDWHSSKSTKVATKNIHEMDSLEAILNQMEKVQQ